MYRAIFKYHPVGQECLNYGQLFGEKIPLFNFVYNCGTNSNQDYVKKAIKECRIKIGIAKLNICIICHFHHGHTSGIPQFLTSINFERLLQKEKCRYVCPNNELNGVNDGY